MAWYHTSWEELWHEHDGFTVSAKEEGETICVYAARFASWVEEHCQHAWEQPEIVSLNQTKVVLVDQYFSFRAVAPKAHRDRIGERGHVCLFTIFERAYARLKIEELALKRPLLFLPPRPPRSPRQQKQSAAAPIMKLPEKLERLLEDFAINEILGEEP